MHCKGEAQKSPLFWRFSGGFCFSQDRLFSRNSTRKSLNLIKSPIFTNAPCKTTCLYNAPSMHTVERLSGQISEQISEKTSETSFQILHFFSKTSFSRRAALSCCSRRENRRSLAIFDCKDIRHLGASGRDGQITHLICVSACFIGTEKRGRGLFIQARISRISMGVT